VIWIAGGEARPRGREGFVEGAAARIGGQQDGAAAQLGRDVGGQRPVVGDQEQIDEGGVVAMQVEDQVGVEREARQRQAQAVQGVARRAARQVLGHRGANRGDVLGLRVAQPGPDGLGDRREEIRPVAVEIAAAGELVASDVLRTDELAQTEGIGVGHHDDLAEDLARRLGRIEPAQEVLDGQHGRHLVGVQRGLEIGLGAGAGRAVAVNQDLAPGAGGGVLQGQAFAVTRHGGLASRSSGRAAIQGPAGGPGQGTWPDLPARGERSRLLRYIEAG